MLYLVFTWVKEKEEGGGAVTRFVLPNLCVYLLLELGNPTPGGGRGSNSFYPPNVMLFFVVVDLN